MKKLLSLLFALVLILSAATVVMPVKAESDTVTSWETGDRDILFSNGYKGFCLDVNLSGAYANDDKYTVIDASQAFNNRDNRNVSQELKKLFVYCFEDIFINDNNEYIIMDKNLIQAIVWHYTDNQYIWGTQKELVDKVAALGDVEIPNDTYQIQHSNGDIITLHFVVIHPEKSGVQDFFAYKLEVTPANASPTSTTVNIAWDDSDDQAAKRPDNLLVTLSNGLGLTLNEANNWSATVENLPKDDNSGQAIAYTWTIGELPEGYSVSNSSTEGTVTTLTLSYAEVVPEETVEVSVKVVWDDADNQDGKRPESLVTMLSDGTEVTLSEENNWTATVENLSKSDLEGNEIEYTWTVEGIPAGYELADTSVEGTVTTLTYDYTPETTSVKGGVEWNDVDNPNAKRPESITINLLEDGEKRPDKVITASDDWKWEFTNLPKYRLGREIIYTISAEEIDGYILEVDGYDVIATYELADSEEPTEPTEPDIPGDSGEGEAEVEPSEPQEPVDPSVPENPVVPDNSGVGEKEEEPEKPQNSSPDTGDFNRVGLWIILLAASMSMMVSVITCKEER